MRSGPVFVQNCYQLSPVFEKLNKNVCNAHVPHGEFRPFSKSAESLPKFFLHCPNAHFVFGRFFSLEADISHIPTAEKHGLPILL